MNAELLNLSSVCSRTLRKSIPQIDRLYRSSVRLKLLVDHTGVRKSKLRRCLVNELGKLGKLDLAILEFRNRCALLQCRSVVIVGCIPKNDRDQYTSCIAEGVDSAR